MEQQVKLNGNMDKYIIYCTPEQTKMALKLGAPIQLWKGFEATHTPTGSFIENNVLYFIPTAEQMIMWLEEQRILIEIYYNSTYRHYNYCKKYGGYGNWGCALYDSYTHGFPSRKDATLAAIDAAFEYLSK